MKQLLASLLLLFSCTTLQAQNNEAANWLHKSDFLVGNEVLRCGVQEKFLNQELHYRFSLQMNGLKDSFDILAGDFVKGDYLSKLFLTNLKSKFNSLLTATPRSQKATIEGITTKIEENSGVITAVEKVRLEGILNELAQMPAIQPMEVLLAKLYDKTIDTSSKEWLDEKMQTLKSLTDARKEDASKDLESSGSNFLNATFDVLAKRAYEGPKVGVLYTGAKVKIRWYKCVYCDNPDPQDEKKGVDQALRKQELENIQKRVAHFKKEDVCYDKGEAKNLCAKFTTFGIKDSLKLTDPDLNIKSVELKFESGQLAGISAKGTVAGFGSKIFTFHNRIPISFSTKFDASQDYHIVRSRRVYCSNRELDGFYIRLDELLYNDYKMSNYTNNYSPIDTVITLKPLSPGKVIFRERLVDILQARVYTDFIGYDEDRPNGLVQLEISKRITLNTRVKAKNKKINTWEFFKHITPIVAFSKIEKNEKYLDVPLLLDSTGDVHAIDLLKHTNFRGGFQLNILTHSLPRLQSTITYDAGMHVLLTGISNSQEERDTVGTTIFQTKSTKKYNALSANFTPVILAWNLYPHNLYHVSLQYKLQSLKDLDSKIALVSKQQAWMHQFGLYGGVRTNESSNGEFFFRLLLDFSNNDVTKNFLQGQIGYTFKVFSRKVEIKNRPIFNGI